MKNGILKLKLNIQSIVMALLSLFLITKVIRTFSGVTDTAGGIWNVAQIIFLLIGLIWLLKYLPSYSDEYPIVFLLLLDFYLFILAFPKLDLSVSGVFNYIMLLYSASIFVLFFIVGMRIELSEKSLLYFVYYIITIIVIVAMVRWYSSGSKASFWRLIDVADVYYSLGLFPLIFIYTEKKNSYIPILFLAVALVLTGKRAGILALVLTALVLYFGRSQNEKASNTIKKIITIVIIGILMYNIATYLDGYFNLGLLSRLSNMREDGGSGRTERWAIVGNAIRNSDLKDLLFGHGWGSVKSIVGGHAHNDFLEVLYEFGFIAALLYVLFFASLFVKLFQMIKLRYRYVSEYLASLICSLFLSILSFYLIKPFYITCGMLCFGFFLSDFKKWKRNMEGMSHVNSEI